MLFVDFLKEGFCAQQEQNSFFVHWSEICGVGDNRILKAVNHSSSAGQKHGFTFKGLFPQIVDTRLKRFQSPSS